MESNVGNFELELDVSATETPDYQKVCVLSIGHDLGEVSDTWNDLCNTVSNTVKLAIDPTWSIAFKLDKTNAVMQKILSLEYAVGAAAVLPARIINKFKMKQIDFDATVSNIAYEPTADAVLEVSFDLKVYSASSFAETTYVEA